MKNEEFLKKFLFFGFILLLILLVFNFFFVFGIDEKINLKINEVKELARPAMVEIINLESSCPNCFDTNPIITKLKESGLNVTNERSLAFNSQESKEFINKYNIEKLPNIIIKGELEKASIQNFKKIEDILIFEGVSAPYQDTKTLQVIGKVSSIIINVKDCELCPDFRLLLNSLKQQTKIYIDKEQIFSFTDKEANEFITNLGLKKLPIIAFSKDIEMYPEILQGLTQSGLSQSGDYYFIESNAPYVESQTGKIRGLVNLTMLKDNDCTACYDINIHQGILRRFGLALGNIDEIDINSNKGKDFITKYSITKIPTVLIDGDMKVYPNFDQIWTQAGTIEEDGVYVFRNMNVLGQSIAYKELDTGKLITNSPNEG